MKSKLLSSVAMPLVLAFSTAAIAQEVTPPPASTPPAEAMPETSPPAPSAVTPAPSVTPSADKSADADAAKGSGTFVASQSADEWRSSKLIGVTVYNQGDEKVGDINDLILDADGKIANAVIGVGGFLGMGEKLVAVPFRDLQLTRDANGTMRATVNLTKDTLETAPEFKYHSDTAAK